MVLMLMELTHTAMVTMERDLLRLNQRLMLMLTTDTHMATDHTDTEPTDMDTHTDTTERDLLMLSQRPRLMLLSCTEPTDMVLTHMLESMVDTEVMDTHTPMDTTERDLLMLSQRLMLTTVMVMDMDTHTPMVPTDHTLMVPTEESGDKHLKSSVQI